MVKHHKKVLEMCQNILRWLTMLKEKCLNDLKKWCNYFSCIINQWKVWFMIPFMVLRCTEPLLCLQYFYFWKNLKFGKLVCIMIVLCAEFGSVANYIAYWSVTWWMKFQIWKVDHYFLVLYIWRILILHISQCW